MQCGYPGAGRLVVTFASALKPQKGFAAPGGPGSFGKPVAVSTKGWQLTVRIAPTRACCATSSAPVRSSSCSRGRQSSRILRTPARTGSRRATGAYPRGQARYQAGELAVRPRHFAIVEHRRLDPCCPTRPREANGLKPRPPQRSRSRGPRARRGNGLRLGLLGAARLFELPRGRAKPRRRPVAVLLRTGRRFPVRGTVSFGNTCVSA